MMKNAQNGCRCARLDLHDHKNPDAAGDGRWYGKLVTENSSHR
jgi:hypothetical protein